MACIPILTYCCVCTPIPAATNCHSTSPQTPPLQGNTLQHVNGAAAANGCHSNKGHTPIQQDHQQEVGAEVWWSGCTQDRLHSAHIPSAAYAYLHDADCGCRRPWRAMKACTKHIVVNPFLPWPPAARFQLVYSPKACPGPPAPKASTSIRTPRHRTHRHSGACAKPTATQPGSCTTSQS